MQKHVGGYITFDSVIKKILAEHFQFYQNQLEKEYDHGEMEEAIKHGVEFKLEEKE